MGIFLILFLVAAPQLYADQSAQSLAASGHAEEAYHELLAQPHEDDPYYFYNLGTLAFRLGQMGQAVAYLEKANQMKRHDPDIRNNLQTVRNKLEQTLGASGLDPSSTWSENLAGQISLDEVRGVLGLLGLIVALFWTRAYLKTRDLRKTFLHPAGLISGTMLLLVTTLYFTERFAAAHTPAIALAHQTIRSGPGTSFLELGQIEPGVKVRLLGPTDEKKEWLQIRFSQEGIGWIKASDLFVLN